jgi:hypothetical protein
MSGVNGLAIANTVVVAVDAVAATVAIGIPVMRIVAIVRLWVPIAISVVVSIAAHPLMDTAGGRVLLFAVPVRLGFVFTVKCDSRGSSHLLALSVILDDLPVLLD